MVKEPWYKSVFISVFLFRKASREIAEQQRKAREEAENKRIEQIKSKVRDGLLSTSEGLLFFYSFLCNRSSAGSWETSAIMHTVFVEVPN